LGYRHIENLFRNNLILLFKECWAMEKIHGTSSHISWKDGKVSYFSGGAKHDQFVSLFNEEDLIARFTALGHDKVILYGEAYGGKLQGMSATYGPNLKFIAFETLVGETWVSVPNADAIAGKLGQEFVFYEKIPATIEALDKARDADSVQAIRNSMGSGKRREGIVARPLIELIDGHGGRIIVKHKGAGFSETKTPRKVGEVVEPSEGIKAALEFVTEMRLKHVVDRLKGLTPDLGYEHIPKVIAAMVEDVEREGEGEVIMNKDTRRAVSSETVKLFKKMFHEELNETSLRGP
jgi:hypothetical protein